MSSNTIISLLSTPEAQKLVSERIKALRLNEGLTQEGLSKRSGVPLPTLRKFERQGVLSLESFLKILAVLGKLEAVVDALKPPKEKFSSVDDMLAARAEKSRKYGWHQ